MSRVLKLVAAVALVAAVFLLFPVGEWFEAAARWAEGLGPVGLVIFAAIYAVATVLMIPGSALTLIGGAAFGFALGTASVWLGATVGLGLAFLVARRFARDRVASWLEGRPGFQAIDRAVTAEGWKIVLLTRLTPVFPFSLQNYAYGLAGVSFLEYLIASAVGILPGTMLYVYIASGVASAVSGESGALGNTLRVLGLVAFVLVTVRITRSARRALREAGVDTGSVA